MKTKPFIIVFPVDADRDEVENLNGNVYTQKELNDLVSEYKKEIGQDVYYYDLDEFTEGVNNQDFDVLTESWIAYVNVIEEEKP